MKQLSHCGGVLSVLLLAYSPAVAGDRPAPAPAPIDRLIRDLGSEDFEAREAASKALRGRGEAALPALYKAMDGDDPEMRRRARDLIEAVEGPLAEKARALVEKSKGRIGPDERDPSSGLLSVSIGKATGAELRLLRYLGPIGALVVGEADLTTSDQDALAGFHELTYLDLSCPKSADVGLAAVEKLTQLRDLKLGGGLTDLCLAHLKALPQLRWVSLQGPGFTDDGLEHLSALTRLTTLSFWGTRITGSGLSRLKALDRLERLDLDHGTTDDGLKPLEKCSGLRSLSIDNAKITDAGLEHIRRLGSLTDLEITGRDASPVTDGGLEILGNLRSLQSLLLWPTEITDDGLAALEGMKDLRELSIESRRITGEGLPILRKLPRLKRLTLDDAPLTDDGLAALKGHPSLEEVHFDQASLLKKGYVDLLRALPHCALDPGTLDRMAEQAKEEDRKDAKDKVKKPNRQ